MEEQTNWEEFIELNAMNIAEERNTKIACKMAIINVIEEIEDCKNFHEVCQVIQTLRLRYE